MNVGELLGEEKPTVKASKFSWIPTSAKIASSVAPTWGLGYLGEPPEIIAVNENPLKIGIILSRKMVEYLTHSCHFGNEDMVYLQWQLNQHLKQKEDDKL